MSQNFIEGDLTFSFLDNWKICRPEESSFYQRHFQSFCSGCKEMDFIAYDPVHTTVWLVEVKDYRANPRLKEVDLADEVAEKTKDVLAMLVAAAIRDNGLSNVHSLPVGVFWRLARTATQIRVVLHCELPISPSKLFPGVKDSANLQTKLSQKLRLVDPHPIFTNRAMSRVMPWTVA